MTDAPTTDAASPDVATAETGGVARSAGILAFGNVASRILGLLRETIISYYFGSAGELSAFRLAARVPTMIYDLLVGGLLSAALVPVFSDYARPERRRELWEVASAVLTAVGVGMAVLFLALEGLAPYVARLIGGGFDDHLIAVITNALRIMAPAVFFFGLAGVLTGILYALKSFSYAALGAAVFNLGVVVCAPLLTPWLGIYSLPVGIAVGSLGQLTLLLPGLRAVGARLRLVWGHPAVRQILRLYAPVSISLLVGQFQVLMDANLTSRTGEQSAAWMQYATTLVQFPLGLVPVAVSLAALPTLSRHAAAGEWLAYRGTLGRGLRLVLVLLIPAIVALFVMAEPIIRLLFEHGSFVAADTMWTARALRLYLLGLGFAGVDFLFNYAFYARQDTRTPAIVGVISVVVYLVVALSLLQPFGFLGLVVADSTKHMSHAIIMLILLLRAVGALRDQGIVRTGIKALLAAAAMGLALWVIPGWLGSLAGGGLVGKFIVVGGAAASGIAIYAALLWLLGVEEAQIVGRMAARRLVRHN